MLTNNPIFKQNLPILVVLGLLVTLVMIGPSFGVTVEALKAPVKDLKTNVFAGWLMPVQILGLACAAGLSFFKQNLIPFGIGVGTVAGINFFDMYLGDGAAGALI